MAQTVRSCCLNTLIIDVLPEMCLTPSLVKVQDRLRRGSLPSAVQPRRALRLGSQPRSSSETMPRMLFTHRRQGRQSGMLLLTRAWVSFHLAGFLWPVFTYMPHHPLSMTGMHLLMYTQGGRAVLDHCAVLSCNLCSRLKHKARWLIFRQGVTGVHHIPCQGGRRPPWQQKKLGASEVCERRVASRQGGAISLS